VLVVVFDRGGRGDRLRGAESGGETLFREFSLSSSFLSREWWEGGDLDREYERDLLDLRDLLLLLYGDGERE